MTDCEKAALLLSARLDGPLSREEEEKLEAHLAQCPACRALAGDLAQLHALLPGMTEPLPQGLHQKILDRVRAEQRAPGGPCRTRRAGSGWRHWAALAAILALVALGAWGALWAAAGRGGADVSDASLMATAAAPDGTGQADTPPEVSQAPADSDAGALSPPDTGSPAGTPEGKAYAPSTAAGKQTPAAGKASPEASPPEPSAAQGSPSREETGAAAKDQQAAPADTAEPADTSAPDQNLMMLAPSPSDSGPASPPAALTEAAARAALQARLDQTGVRGELTALGLSPNGEYYEFSLAGADGAEENRYAVALDGGTVVPRFLAGDDGTPADNGAAYRRAVGEE